MAHNDSHIWIKYFSETHLPLSIILIFPPLFSRPTTPSFSQKRSRCQYQKQDTVALTRAPKPNEIPSPWLKKSFLFVIAHRFEKKRSLRAHYVDQLISLEMRKQKFLEQTKKKRILYFGRPKCVNALFVQKKSTFCPISQTTLL